MENKVYLLETTTKNENWITEFHKNRVFSTMKAAQERLKKYFDAALKKDDVVDFEYNNYDSARVEYVEYEENMTMFLTITPLIVDEQDWTN